MLKRLLLLFFLIFGYSLSWSQTREQLNRANKMLDSLNKANSKKIKELEKTNPRAAAVMRELQSKIAKANPAIKSAQENVSRYLDVRGANTLPSAHPERHINAFVNADKSAILQIARDIIHKVDEKISASAKDDLNKMLLDTNVNAAATGIFLMMNGLPKSEGSLLIARDVLLHPENPWKVNDMGVLLRDNEQYREAILTFKYADKILQNSLTVKTNIGWTAFYYGDFPGAKEFFDAALALNEYYRSALEGRALVAYREGDLQALFKCLMKEVTSLGGGANAPSEAFMQVCDAALSEQDNINLDTQDDPTKITLFDNIADNDSKQPGGGSSDLGAVDFPEFEGMFDLQPCNWLFALSKTNKFLLFEKDNIPKYIKEINSMRSSLPPITREPYVDVNGEEVIPKDYSKSLAMYDHIEALYYRRVTWHFSHLRKELKKLLDGTFQDALDTRDRYFKAIQACGGKPECVNAVNCTWFPIMKGKDNNNLNNKFIVFHEYFEKMIEESDWFNRLSSIYIKRIRNPQWNSFLNNRREYQVRSAVMRFYDAWATNAVGLCMIYCNAGELKCSTPMRGTSGEKGSAQQKPKKIATFPEPCYSSPMSGGIPGFVSVEFSCEQDKISLGPDALKMGMALVHKHSADQEDYFRTSISTGISVKENLGKYEFSGSSSAGADLKLEATASVYFDMDQHFNTIRRGAKLDLSATGDAQLSTGIPAADMSLGLQASHGISAGVEIIAQCGQNAQPGYKVILSGDKK